MPRRRGKRRPAHVQIGGARVNPASLAPDPNFRPVSLEHAKEGWRAWMVSRDLPAYGLPPKLYSVSHNYHWAPKRKAEAQCSMCEGGEGVPGVDCGCGFYSAKSLKHLMQMGYHLYTDIDESKSFKVVGQVACWGKVIEGTQGWRSQYAYPVYLMVPYEMAGTFGPILRDAYGCKVRPLNFLKQPHEISDEFIADLMAGKPHIPVPERETRQGRRVGHKQLRFVGRTKSDVYEREGKRMVDVTWDVTPERTVPIQLDHLEFEPA